MTNKEKLTDLIGITAVFALGFVLLTLASILG